MKNFSRRYGSDLQNGERLILSFFCLYRFFVGKSYTFIQINFNKVRNFK